MWPSGVLGHTGETDLSEVMASLWATRWDVDVQGDGGGHSEIALRALTWRVENNNPRFQQCQHPDPDLVPSPRGEPCLVQIAVAFPAPQAAACYFTGPETTSLRASRALTASITGSLLFTHTPPSQTHFS